MQIPIINGIYSDESSDYRISYPVNMRPVVQDTGISTGYLRPVEGATLEGSMGPGRSRAAINWKDVHYRVMGSKLCSIDSSGAITILGDVGDDGNQASMTYSFDLLAVASNGNLFYYDGSSVTQVTDVNLGTVIDVVWVDGYFMTTDGENLVITELTNPYIVNPLKYGSSEADPDPVVALVKLRNEIYAVNRYTIEVFNNVGSQLFPFQRIDSAQIQRGAIGTHCVVVYEETIAFLGSAHGESPGVYLAGTGTSQKISSREIDEILSSYTEVQLSSVVMETVNDRSHALLWVRLPDKTLGFDLKSTQAVGQLVWYVMSSGTLEAPAVYRPIDVIWCYNDWKCGDILSFGQGRLDDTVSTHFGVNVPWEFGTKIVYNKSKGALFHSLELVGLPGRTAFGDTPYISTSYSLDGRTWSQERFIEAGVFGDRAKRMVWRRQGSMRNGRMQRFRGDSQAYLAVARLEAELEPLTA